jgi:cold shock CspA family protein
MSSNTNTAESVQSSTTDTNTNTDRLLGLVKWFHGGFGFVTNFDTKEDVFIHHSSITTNIDCWKLVYPGEYVHFSLGTMEDGKSQAVDVTGVRRGPLRCETLALLRQERDDYNQDNNQDNNSPTHDNSSSRNTYSRSGGHNRGRNRNHNGSHNGSHNGGRSGVRNTSRSRNNHSSQ